VHLQRHTNIFTVVFALAGLVSFALVLGARGSELCGGDRRSYYNWREGPWSDLQLFLLFNASIILAGGFIKHNLLPRGVLEQDAATNANFFQDIYEVNIQGLFIS